MSRANRTIGITSRLILLGILILFVGCNKAAKPSYQVFASPDDAGSGKLHRASLEPVFSLLTTKRCFTACSPAS
jgi:hypothetical protein